MSDYSYKLQKDRYVVIDDFEFSEKSKTILDLYSGWDDPSEYNLVASIRSSEDIPENELEKYNSENAVLVNMIQQRLNETDGVPTTTNRDHFRFSRLVTEVFDGCGIDFEVIGRMSMNASFNNNGSNQYNSLPHLDHQNPICKYNMIIYLTDSDGDTVLWEGFDKLENPENTMVEIKPKKYRIVIFDGSLPHATKKPSSGIRKVFVATVY